MRIQDLGKLTFGAVFAHRMRSILTILGIMVGIGAVVSLTAIGEGVRVFVLSEFTQFGTNVIGIVPGKSNTFGASGATVSTVRPLSIEDAIALEQLDDILAVVPVVQGNASVEFGSRKRRTMVLGVGHAVPDVWQMPIASGRFLPNDDYQSSRSFAVLGSKMKDELFGNINPLGQRIRVGTDRYRVIGVMASKGQLLGIDLDDTIYLPIGKVMEMFDRESLMEIDLTYEPKSSSSRMEDNIKRLLLARHGHEDFTVVTQEQMLDILDTILDVLTLGVAAIGSISLFVGAVGIVTIMTIAVSERITEIGLLRALGARRVHVMSIFLGEAILLSGLGGLCGITLVFIVVFLVNSIAPGFPLHISWFYAILAFVLSLVIGIIAGIAPAVRAAKLHPLEALRAE
jgi:putative ABC transport system permease protein